jgi:hypothetical protein
MSSLLNLILALIWLVAGLVVFSLPWLSPGTRPPTILDTGISLGWAFLVMVLYNLVRWAVRYAAERQQRALKHEMLRRWREHEQAEQQGTPDPAFDFSEGPPPPKETR